MQNGTECDACTALNGSYVAEFAGESEGTCLYEYPSENPESSTVWIQVWITKWSETEYSIEVWMFLDLAECAPYQDQTLYWYDSQPTPYNCLNLNMSVPLDYDEAPEGCNSATATLIS